MRTPPMQDAALIEALSNATSLELYQLAALVERLMSDGAWGVPVFRVVHRRVAPEGRFRQAVGLAVRCGAQPLLDPARFMRLPESSALQLGAFSVLRSCLIRRHRGVFHHELLASVESSTIGDQLPAQERGISDRYHQQTPRHAWGAGRLGRAPRKDVSR